MKRRPLTSFTRLLDYAEFSETIRKYGVIVALIIYISSISGLFTSDFTSVKELGSLTARISLLVIQVIVSLMFMNTVTRLQQAISRSKKKTIQRGFWYILTPLLLVAISLVIYTILAFS